MLGLLARAPHTVMVQKRAKQTGERGERLYANDGRPIAVKCVVQPVREWSTAEETMADGLQLLSLLRVFSRDWPGDLNSQVLWKGDRWETVGDPQHHHISPRTAHWEITLRRLGKAKETDDTEG